MVSVAGEESLGLHVTFAFGARPEGRILNLYPPTWVVTEITFHFSLGGSTICSTKRTLRTWRRPFLLLITMWFYQMNIWEWILQISPCHFPPALILRCSPAGTHGCSPCTTQLQRTCCQVCVPLPSSFRFHCKQLLMVSPVPVWRWDFLEGKRDFRPSCCIVPKRLKNHCCLGWIEVSIGVGHVSECAVFWVSDLQKRTKIRHPQVTSYSSLD